MRDKARRNCLAYRIPCLRSAVGPRLSEVSRIFRPSLRPVSGSGSGQIQESGNLQAIASAWCDVSICPHLPAPMQVGAARRVCRYANRSACARYCCRHRRGFPGSCCKLRLASFLTQPERVLRAGSYRPLRPSLLFIALVVPGRAVLRLGGHWP